MPACAVRYRLNSAGPLTLLVEYEGRFFIYTRGALGAALPPVRVAELLTGRGGRWVADAGELIVDGPLRLAPSTPIATTAVAPMAAAFRGDGLAPRA